MAERITRHRSRSGVGSQRASIALTILATIGTTLALVVATLSSEARTVAAVFPPWWSPATVLAAAASAGSVVDVGRLPSSVIVTADRPGLAARLRAAGAVFILDAGLADGCRTPASDRTP